MAFLKVAIALCATLYLTSAQFIPGPQPACSPTTFNSHEVYCDMYYRCISPASGLVPMQCPQGTQWDARSTVCNIITLPNTGVCENWQCNGGRYPDVCCNAYWTCSSANAWVKGFCPAGTTFDMSSGQCLQSGTVACVENKFCTRNLVNNPNFVCSLAANPSGDNCTYIQAGYVRDCPEGTSFNAAECGCSNRAFFNGQCAPKFDFALNKAKDSQCRASFKTEFTNSASLYAYSDKLGKYISDRSSTPNLRYGGGYYLGADGAVSVNGNEAQLLSNGYIYSNYFSNNEIHTPTAFVVTFRPTNFPSNTNVNLLTNTFTYLNNVICGSSISVSVRNEGFVNIGNGLNTDYRYTFTINLSGQNFQNQDVSANINDLSINVQQSTISGLGESGSSLNYLRFTLALSGSTAIAQVEELNSAININPNRQARTAAFGVENLRSNKCGLTVGSTMTGSVREFTVYEGCDNSFVNLII